MIRVRRHLFRLAVVAATAVMLSGCVSLLPKQKPAILYRFDGHVGAMAAPVTTTRSVPVLKVTGGFQREAAGDRLLTITGDKAAYVARARWVAPAVVLFDEAVTAAFDAATGPVRLVARGEPARAAFTLRLDVRNFETHYDQGPEAAPLVIIRVRATMTRTTNIEDVQEQMFEARVRASDNRVGPITTAYDAALSELLGKLVPWTEGKVS